MIARLIATFFDPLPELLPVVPSPFDEPKKKAAGKAKEETIKVDKNGFVSVDPETETAQIEFHHAGLPTANGRETGLTDADRALLKLKGLKEVAAAKSKPYWARELTTGAAAKEINKWGLGERTLDSYWAVFNSAQ